MALDNNNDDKRKCIIELRNRVAGLLSSEMYEDESMFSRFLIARNYDLDAAEKMLKFNLNWRKINKIDSLLTDYDPPEAASKYLSFCHIGFSKEGFPVSFSRSGNIDFKGLLKTLKKAEVLLYIARSCERDTVQMKIKSEEMGKNIDKCIYIFDLSNFSIFTATYRPALDIMIGIVNMFDNIYPERLKNAYIINASLYFTIFWAILSPFLAGETLKKVKVFGKDGWHNDLLNDIDADILPAYVGGKRTDPDGDPMCITIVNQGGPVPAKYYALKDNTFRKSPTTNKIVLRRFSKEHIKMIVEKPGSILEWELEVKKGDIGFSVLYKDNENNDSLTNEVVPKQRIETIISSETGKFRCKRSGIYILEFDNTYSWIYSKDVYYTVAVLMSDQEVTSL